MKRGRESGIAFLVCTFMTLFHFSAARAQEAISNPTKYAKTPGTTAPAPRESWVPDDIDHVVPSVAAGTVCSLPDVLTRAGQKVEEIVENVDRFTATEILSHQAVDSSGKMRRPTTLKFDYLVSISKGRDGFLEVDEFRNRSDSLDLFPSHIATVGISSLVLIFHPRYIGDFKIKCEGLGEWKGQPAWQVRFEQRTDRPNRTSAFVVNRREYSGDLRGRAWILADSYQIARLNTDEERPIPKISLRRSHESVEYRPVGFPNNNLQLWLPSSAEVYMDFRGHRFYRKHSFTDFKLFSVDTNVEVGEPKETETPRQPAP
jgi:hypothetical protein